MFDMSNDSHIFRTQEQLWSTRKIHRATIWGSVFLILMGQTGGFIGPTAPWHAFAHWAQRLIASGHSPLQLTLTESPQL
jgi:hypothetical protein